MGMLARLLLIFVLLLTCAGVTWGKPPVRVVVAGDAPFVVLRGRQIDGLAVRIWESAAQQAKLPCVLQTASSTDEALSAVVRGDADVAIGRIAITARRAREVTFTQPFYSTTLSIAVTSRSTRLFERLLPFVYGLLAFFVAVAFLLFTMGNLVWMFERHQNRDTFPSEYFRGVGQGMWMSVVTMTSVGYGDAVPITFGGRLVMAGWMLVAMLFSSTVTASLTSVLTEYRLSSGVIDTPSALTHKVVAMPRSAASAEYANRLQAKVVEVPTLEAAVSLLSEGKADAILYYKTEMRWFAKAHPEVPMILTSVPEARFDFGFALRRGSPLDDPLDQALLEMRENGQMGRVEEEFLQLIDDVAGLHVPARDASAAPASL